MTKKRDSTENAIRDIRRATRRRYSAEEKIRIVLEGLRGESSIAELCRKEGINQNLYYRGHGIALMPKRMSIPTDTGKIGFPGLLGLFRMNLRSRNRLSSNSANHSPHLEYFLPKNWILRRSRWDK